VHNEDLQNLYSLPNILRVMKSRNLRGVGHVTRVEEMRNAYNLVVGKPQGKRPLERPRQKREDNIKMALKETGCEDVG